MKYRKKVLRICAFLCICIITGWITANIIAKPIYLTDKEIIYYTDIAKKVWYEGLESVEEDDSIYITFDLAGKKVNITPQNGTNQSVTADFSSSELSITVNDPVVSFWGCFFFYGTIFGLIIYVIIDLGIFIVKESKKK